MSKEVINFHGMLTASKKMLEVFEIIRRIAKTDSSILIRGDTGTGKELIARAIHDLSSRRGRAYRAINCAAFVPELINSELFGHEKGSFTGAYNRHTGLLETCNQGTLFLDEIAEMPLEIQSRLLRFLQDGTFNKLGSTRAQSANVRIVSATHRALRKMVKEKTFREDLMYRIRVVPIYIPPLKERIGDIALLTQAFIKEFNKKQGRKIDSISQDAITALQNYDWPGNIRELRNNIEYAFAISDGHEIAYEHLTPELRGIEAHDAHIIENAEDLERNTILQILHKVGGHRGKAADKLGISRATLWRKCREYGI